MQHLSIRPSRPRSPWRTVLTCLGILLLTTNVAAASIPERRGETTPAYTIPRHLLVGRQTTINITAYYEQECGLDFEDCGEQSCCRAGQECLVGTTSGELLCRPLPGSSPTPAPTASSESSGSNPVPVAGIVGGVLGTVVVVATLCVLYLLYRRAHPDFKPEIPQAPIPDFPNMKKANYPTSDTASYSGDIWQPGNYMYMGRNRSVSASNASTRICISPTPIDAISPSGGNTYQSLAKSDAETPHIIELPDSAVSPPMELPAEDYFEEKPQPPPPPPPETRDLPLPKPPSSFMQYLKKSRNF